MSEKESIFSEEDIQKLVDCITEGNELEEAQRRTNLTRKKLIRAVEAAEPQEVIEELMQEAAVASEAEMRLAIASIQNKVWMKQMKKRIEIELPDLHQKAEALVLMNGDN